MPIHPPATDIRDFLAAGELSSVYQPVVDLIEGELVAYEALARGRPGSAFELPQTMFAAARVQALVAELDAACRAAAVSGALEAGIAPPLELFVNIEPAGIDGSPLLDARQLDLVSRGALRLVLEFTERELTFRPAEVLALVAHCRALGCGIALDDVGDDPRSVALLPFVSPDVIKLDMRLVQRRHADAARTIYAVAAEAERYGAAVLAEGIETDAHRETAIALGATLGQGYLFGGPGVVRPRTRRSAGARGRRHRWTPGRMRASARMPRRPAVRHSASSPFEIISARRPVRRADKSLLAELSRQLEIDAAALGPEAVVLAGFQHARFLTGTTAARYAEMARRVALVAAIGVGMPTEPAPGVRGTCVDPGSPLADGWTVAVIAPHFSAAFSARPRRDHAGDRSRLEFVLTHDRDLVIQASLALMQHVIPGPPGLGDPTSMGHADAA